MFDPDANSAKQRRLIAYSSILQPVCSAWMIFSKSVAQRIGISAMTCKARISERNRLESVQKDTFRMQLWQLRSLETATKKRRVRKKKAANDTGLTKSTMKTSD